MPSLNDHSVGLIAMHILTRENLHLFVNESRDFFIMGKVVALAEAAPLEFALWVLVTRATDQVGDACSSTPSSRACNSKEFKFGHRRQPN